MEKRGGSGPHNWGDEIEAQLQQPETPAETTTDPENTETMENTENKYVQEITIFHLSALGVIIRWTMSHGDN